MPNREIGDVWFDPHYEYPWRVQCSGYVLRFKTEDRARSCAALQVWVHKLAPDAGEGEV